MSKILEIAGGYVGETEIKGAQHNPKIVAMFKKSGNEWVEDDETPWCAAFVGAVLKDAGIKGTMKLNARSYLNWGQEVTDPEPGDVVVFWRGTRNGWQGHVAFFVRFNPNGDIVVMGGNQGDAVSVKPYKQKRWLGYRRAVQVVKPKPVKKVAITGGLIVVGITIGEWLWDKIESFGAFIGGLF